MVIFASGCSAPTPTAELTKTSEYFAESEYGVKASPRVALRTSGLPRGGGRYQVGKAYQIKGRWYKPQEDPDYVAEGAASWYGEAFHGRLTANGEVYDMTHLTAAHPTMPLPSYARVTNMQNGSSVLVRVNDRGPFARDRVIDLSKRAAELLDYKEAGVARVRVEYVGPAPLHGEDDGFLLASYQPGGAAPDPSDGLPSGVLVAMNGPTPTRPVSSAVAAFASQPGLAESAENRSLLPAVGPIVPDRPAVSPVPSEKTDVALLSYTGGTSGAARKMFEPLVDGRSGEGEERPHGARPQGVGSPAHIHLGAWSSLEEAKRIARDLERMGSAVVEEERGPDGRLYIATLMPDGRAALDEMLRAAWSAGATDAFFVRE